MCSPENEKIMNAVIDDYVATQKQFTAFDATQSGRNQGTTETHSQIKRCVHARWADGSLQNQGYARELIQIPNVSVDPWLYFPTGTDPQDYLNALDVSDPDSDDDDDDDGDDYITSPSSNVAGGGGGGVVDTAVRSTSRTAADRLQISTLKIAKAGWIKGQAVDVLDETGNARIRVIPSTVADRLQRSVWKIPEISTLWFKGKGQAVDVLDKTGNARIRIIASDSFSRPQRIATLKVNDDGRLRLSPAVLEKLSGSSYKVEASPGGIVVTSS